MTRTYESTRCVVERTSTTGASGEKSTTTHSYRRRSSSNKFFISSEPRISFECTMRDVETAGKKVMFVMRSFHTTSSREALPEMTSRLPAFAVRASTWESQRLRKSPSTK